MSLTDRHWIEETIEGAYWHFDENRKALPISERDVFKMVLRGVFAEAQLRSDAAVAKLDELRKQTIRLLDAHRTNTRSHSASLCDVCTDTLALLDATRHPLSTGKPQHTGLPGTPEEWACIHCKTDTRNTGGHFSDDGIECGNCWSARLTAEKLDRWAER